MDAELDVQDTNTPLKRPGSTAQILPARAIWLLVAAAFCWLSWPADAEAQQACSHDYCEEGSGLNSSCDPCVTAICDIDSFCCQTGWDQNCIDQVLTVCQDWICAAACSHSPCEVGEALDSTCNSCTAQVCFEDPSCCTDTWDAICTSKVKTSCGYQCSPGANRCDDALPIYPGRIFGTLMGSNNDGCETLNASCRSGDVWYSYTHVADQDLVFSTCTTERSFGIDTVLSIHEGCPGLKNNEIESNDDWLLGNAPTTCSGTAAPNYLDAAFKKGFDGFGRLTPGQTVVIRVSHHDDSIKGNFELRLLPEPEAWMALVAGAALLGAISRRRARS